jgi:hypothetical protein
MISLRTLTLTALLSATALLTGCASITMSQPKPTLETTAALRANPLAPATVGSFQLDPKGGADDRKISLRGANSVQSPVDGSFAQYLRESIKVELQAAGLYDAKSNAVIAGALTQSDADPAMGTGTAKLGARFTVTRDGAVRYDRELVVDDSWESSFVGAVAIPAAAAHYEGLYRKLAAKLLNDADFRAALARQ